MNEAENMKYAFKSFAEAVKISGDHNMFFEHKLEKHWDNPTKLAGYLCYRYTNQPEDAEFIEPHFGARRPIAEFIKKDELAMKAVNRIKEYGWQVKVGEWPGLGTQLIVMRNDARCYHSEYKWD